jgi:hypothetical protein
MLEYEQSITSSAKDAGNIIANALKKEERYIKRVELVRVPVAGKERTPALDRYRIKIQYGEPKR